MPRHAAHADACPERPVVCALLCGVVSEHPFPHPPASFCPCIGLFTQSSSCVDAHTFVYLRVVARAGTLRTSWLSSDVCSLSTGTSNSYALAHSALSAMSRTCKATATGDVDSLPGSLLSRRPVRTISSYMQCQCGNQRGFAWPGESSCSGVP